VSRYQKGKANLDFAEARASEWQWHQLGHMQVCTLLQTDNHASIPLLSFYRPDALSAANQQRQSTEGADQFPDQQRKSGWNSGNARQDLECLVRGEGLSMGRGN